MRKLFAKLTVVLLICALMLAVTGCDLLKQFEDYMGFGEIILPERPDKPNEEELPDDTDKPAGDEQPGDTEVVVDKSLLEAELALEVMEQGDYTSNSYNAYLEKLAAAKAVAEAEDATQSDVDAATMQLTAARRALTLRPIEAVKDAVKELRMISGDVKEIVIADYVNVNGLSNITYEVKSSNPAAVLSAVEDGKFTVTAEEVNGALEVLVSIDVSYNGVKKLAVQLSLTITNDITPVLNSESVLVEHDVFDLANKESLVIDFAKNVSNVSNLPLTYTVKLGDETLSLEGTSYTLTLGSYTESFTYTEFAVTVDCTVNGEEKTLTYTYKLGLKDTSAYRVVNGNFESGLDGWTFNNTLGDQPFAGIDEKTKFWIQEFPMNNVGKYFSAYADGASEYSQGTLASAYFIVNSEYATYMLSGGGNRNVYITIENEQGEVLALYRNTMFADLPDPDMSFEDQNKLIGQSVFLCNFVTYKVDLSAFSGQKIRFVIHDHASEGWGVVFFDELNTYYTSEDTLPEGAILAENLLANKSSLSAELANEVAEQGDYTLDSYNAYAEKLAAAKALLNDVAATQEMVDNATVALYEARLALTVRPVVEIEAQKAFKLISGNVKELLLSDYVNANGLSKITYEIRTSSAAAVLSAITDGKFTVTAAEVSENTTATVTIVVYYDGVEKLAVELTFEITNDVAPTLNSEAIVKEYDLYELANKESITLDFAENVNNLGNLALTYTAKRGGEAVTLDGTSYTLVFGSYTDKLVYEEFTVTVTCLVNGTEKSIQYTYKLGLKDTTAYRVANGNFENGLDGWLLNNTLGDKPFGGIDEKTTFWGEEYPMFNVGKYFSAYADGAEEYSHGSLASAYFVVNSEYATYMLGGAGNHNVYITIESKDGKVLALYRNTAFADLPAGDYSLEDKRAMIGNTVFLANFVTFKVDLSAFAGQEVRFVIHDYASAGWGVVFFDELVTYYESSDSIPRNALLAENLLADKSLLNAELALEVAEQGDYTLDSYNAYFAKLAEAKALLSDVAVTQATVDEITASLSAAREALAVRPVLEVEGANKSFRLTCGCGTELALENYVNTNGLSKITYSVLSSAELVNASLVDGKLVLMAGDATENTIVTVTLVVYYDGVEKLRVELAVEATSDLAPTLFGESVVKEYDVYALDNKDGVTLNFADNVDNAGNLDLTYSVQHLGNTLVLDGTSYTFAFGSYTDKVTYEAFTVIVKFVANGKEGTLEYTYKLAMKDTTKYRLVNGDFENGMDGWTQVGNIGGVSSDRTYWVEGIEFGMDGDKMFSAYAPGALESAVGTLTSSRFVVGGSGFVTFKVGAMRDANYVYVDVVDAETNEILARYFNGLWTDADLSGCKLVAYKADLSAFAGREVYFRISDNADSGYGLFFVDSFVTYYENEPDGFNAATAVDYQLPGTIYDVFNGGFEMGDVQGWWNNGEPGKVTGAEAFFSGVAYGKDGNFLYSGVEDFQAGNGREGNRGVLTSSVFEIGGTGYISFKLGGGGNALCYVQVIDAVTGEVLARYRQQAMQDAVLIQYVADLSAYVGRTVRFQVVDQAGWDWGCVSFDNLVTYYPTLDTLPAGLTANDIKGDIKYTVENGSFETGNIDGWTMHITESGAHNTVGWVLENEIDAGWYTKNDDTKDGRFLFTFAQPGDINCENTKGTLESSTFTLKKDSFVSFKFGAAGGFSNHDVYIELCRADGSVIARFYNDAPGKVNTKMNSYYYQYQGEDVECFFRVVDNSTGDYGCLVVDDFRVNLESAPEGYIAAIQ